MAYLANISFRRSVALFLLVLVVLITGTWTAVKLTTDHLINADARMNASNWAQFLAANIADLQQIAAGESPSVASMVFLNGTRNSSQVFRYVIYNRLGYSQLIADHQTITSVDMSEFSPVAAQSITTKMTIVEISKGNAPGLPAFFAHAYVPVLVDGEPIAAVAAFVDESEQRANFRNTFLIAAISLCGLTALSFGIPAIAWYRRTKEKQQGDRRIRFLAHHDILTGLTNRARLIERMEAILAILPSQGGHIAVHFIDIDHFKQVNDTLGHDGGDFLLTTIAHRLRSAIRIDDLVARLGGDEFIVVQNHVADKKQAEEFATRLTAALTMPIEYKGQEIVAGITIGVALATVDGNTPERLMKSADLALYNGKMGGRNCIRFFSPDMDAALQARLKLERIIRDAVAKDQFALHFQPVFEMKRRQLLGYEALIRLPMPDGTLIPPMTFIPVVEELHLIDKVGAWVLREACRTAATWPDDLTVAVNLSPAQFESGNIVATVASALKESGLAPKRLELEITEMLLMRNNERIMIDLEKLKASGVSIVMDDFGTGYSSLSYLWKFPFDKIKIDRSFMEGFDNSGRDAETVVKTIIALGRELKMRVTVEGVETSNQVEFLHDVDADQVQGFYFGRPIPASDIGANILGNFRKARPDATVKPGTKAAQRKASA